MNSSGYLANRLREVLTEGKWVTGTNVKDQIIHLNWKDAIESVNGLNSIALLTFHIHYYIDGVMNVFEGGPLEIRDVHSFDAPPIQSADDWNDLIHRFCVDAEKFIQLVEKLSAEKLMEDFVGEKYGSIHRNIDAMIEHCYYHLGQMLIIKKLIDQAKNGESIV
jgi:Protein of unknown function (DUF1572)